MKVYELAKKLEVKSVFLMDKIRREWNLPVKTHMEALTPELVKKIEDRFYSSQKPVKKKPLEKKTATQKITKKAKTKSAVQKKKTAKKTSAHKKQLSTKKPESSARSLEKPVNTSPKKKIIIRRKTDEQKPVQSSRLKAVSLNEDKTSVASPRKAPAGSLRLDMVSVKSADPLDESFWEKEEEKKPVRKQIKKPLAEKEISSKFNATDFRKREVIFQPRKKRTAQVGEFKSTPITTPKSYKRVIKVHGEMSMEKLCRQMGLKRQALIKKLKAEGVDTKGLLSLDFETIALIVPAFGFSAKNTKPTEEEILNQVKNEEVKQAKTVPKTPVVTIMGHVDHGKTTLLDCIRKSKVVETEAGGITQHIGAYSVFVEGKGITFIDTPGHSAFTAMRSRGAKLTDIVVILVSAEDGVKPQTLEALSHAKAAKTPVIVAISKMDKAGANPDRVKKQMSEHGLVPEDWGGDISFVPVSAVKREGIQELLEQINLQAEIQELSYRPLAPAKGVVLEACKEKGLGSIVSLLIQDGSLKLGQYVIAGECVGKIRQMKNDKGQIVKEMPAGFPVSVMGFSSIPQAGDVFHSVKDEKTAQDLLTFRKDENRGLNLSSKNLTPEEILAQMELSSKEKTEVNIILKADGVGGLEALKNSLENIKSEEVSLKIVHSGAGAVTESDVLLASTVNGVILAFNVRPDGKAVHLAKEKFINIYSYSVIYEMLDQVKKLMLGMLKSDFVEEEQGRAEVRDVFHISKVVAVAGCYITKGKIPRASFVRLVRDGRLIYNGPLSSLRRFKEDVKQVGEGLECGISLEKFNDIKPKDVLESYVKKEKPRTEL